MLIITDLKICTATAASVFVDPRLGSLATPSDRISSLSVEVKYSKGNYDEYEAREHDGHSQTLCREDKGAV